MARAAGLVQARNMKFLLLFLCPALAWGQGPEITSLPSIKPEEAGMSPEVLAKIGPAVEALIAEKKLVGACVLVMRKGNIVYEESFGMRDAQAREAMECDTIFRIYSMTKALTSTLALMLCEEGKLSLDDPVENYLPELKMPRVWVSEQMGEAANRLPTVRDLLRHTGGFASRGGGHPVSKTYREAPAKGGKNNLAHLVGNIGRSPLLYQPGKKWVYGASTDLLAAVVAAASGKPFETVLSERLLLPLAMIDTGYWIPEDKVRRLSVRYQIRNGEITIGDPANGSVMLQDPDFKGGGSGLLSTARDYARFLQMIANGGEFGGKHYLRKDSVELMRTNQLPRHLTAISFGPQIRHGTAFGLGFAVRIADDERWDPDAIVGEYGWGGAASTHYWVCPQHDLVVITMEQTMPYNENLELALKPIIYKAVLK